VIRDATQVIQDMGSNAFPGMLTYTNVLQVEDPELRIWAAQVIGNCGELSLPFVGSLLERTNDPDGRVREAVSNALIRISTQW
jgi:hypothetical protein